MASFGRSILATMLALTIIALVSGQAQGTRAWSPNSANETVARLPVLFGTGEQPPKQSDYTRIIIDGQKDDWADRPLCHTDPLGDAEIGYMDLGAGYAFVNRDALYFCVQLTDPMADMVQFDLILRGDGDWLISTDGNGGGFIGDISDGWAPVGETELSRFSMAQCLEGRISLGDLGLAPGANLDLDEINVMVGACCEPPAWRAADVWEPNQTTPVINEVDHPRLTSDNESWVLARQFGLPMWDWVGQVLYAPPLPEIVGIGKSLDGTIFVLSGGINPGLSVLDPNTGTALRILDTEFGSSSHLVAGEADTVYVKSGESVWHVSADGTYSVWADVSDAHPLCMYSDGRMIGREPDWQRVVEIAPGGAWQEIASGFQAIDSIVVGLDDRLYVSDSEAGSITRIDTDGSKHLLADALVFRDPMDLGYRFPTVTYI